MNVHNRWRICSAPGGVYRWENLQEKLDFLEIFLSLKFSKPVLLPFLAWGVGGGWGELTLECKPSFGSVLEVLGSSVPRKVFLR